jgi:hypothetical protein
MTAGTLRPSEQQSEGCGDRRLRPGRQERLCFLGGAPPCTNRSQRSSGQRTSAENCCPPIPLSDGGLARQPLLVYFPLKLQGTVENPSPTRVSRTAPKWPHSKPQFQMTCRVRCTRSRVRAAFLSISWWKKLSAASFHRNLSRASPKRLRKWKLLNRTSEGPAVEGVIRGDVVKECRRARDTFWDIHVPK